MRGTIKTLIGKKGKSYKVIVDIGTTGKRKQKTKTFKKKSDAEKWLAETLSAIQSGTFSDPGKLTIAQYMDKWFATHKKSLAPYTERSYNLILQKHIIPHFGDVFLKKLSPIQIQDYVNTLEDYSPGTIRNILQVLKTSLNQAIEWQIINRNPAEYVKIPNNKKEPKNILTEEQITILMERIKKSMLYAPVFLAIYTGMRLGEILGLRWEDVDLEKGIIQVRQQLCQTKGEPKFTPPKTASSRRTIDISSSVVRFLKEQKRKQAKMKLKAGPGWVDYNLICCREDGSPMRPNTISVCFLNINKELGFGISFHNLRHTHASLLLKAGVPPKVVSERLGHSTISITMDIYSHVIPGMQKEAAEKLDELLARD